MFEYNLADTKRDQQLKLTLSDEEATEIATQTAALGLATRQDFVKFCINYYLTRQEVVVFEPDEEDENLIEGIDWDLVQFLADNPGSKRKEIENGLHEHGHDNWHIDKAMKRCKAAGLIKREGETVQARWYDARGELS